MASRIALRTTGLVSALTALKIPSFSEPSGSLLANKGMTAARSASCSDTIKRLAILTPPLGGPRVLSAVKIASCCAPADDLER